MSDCGGDFIRIDGSLMPRRYPSIKRVSKVEPVKKKKESNKDKVEISSEGANLYRKQKNK